MCRVWLREDNEAFMLHPDHFEPLKAAWMGGATFYIGSDCYGDEIVLKLATIAAISHGTPEAMNQAEADSETYKLTNPTD